MAQNKNGRQTQGSGNIRYPDPSNDRVDMGNDSGDDSWYIIIIIILFALILFFLPVLGWMYADIRESQIKVDKLIKKLESKWNDWYVRFSCFYVHVKTDIGINAKILNISKILSVKNLDVCLVKLVLSTL